MIPPIVPTPLWTTSSFGQSTDTSPMELASLGDHLTLCKTVSTRWLKWHWLTDNVRQFFAARLLTTLLLVLAVAGIAIGVAALLAPAAL